MKKSYLAICILLVVALLTTACEISMVTGSGNIITQNRSVSGFNSITFAGLGELNITQGSSEGLTIEGEDNVLAKIKTEVSNGNLYIGFERDNWQDVIRPTRTLKFNLKVRSLSSLDLSGLGNVTIDQLDADSLTLRISGAGGLKVSKLNTGKVTCTMSGAGNVVLAGKATDQMITLSGLGNYAGGDLDTQQATITLSGAGGATVLARNTLNVKISGAGSVSYYENPKISKDISGLGVLNSLGNK